MLSLAARATMIAIKPKMVLWGIVLLAASAVWDLVPVGRPERTELQQNEEDEY